MTDGTIAARFKGVRGTFSIDARFEVPMRGVTALFGPSGSGKTTLLRCLAGLDRLDGSLSIGTETWQDDARGVFVAPHRRSVGYVFQEASLFAHLSVRDNLLFGAARTPARQAVTFDEVVGLTGIAPLLTRAPQNLSGGERQRVALGRALLSQPRVLLMDEPLSALDRATRDEILPYFEALHDRLAVPILYVSHDMAEVERLADTLVLIDSGRVVAAGSLGQMAVDPKLPLVQLPDAGVTLAATVVDHDRDFGLTRLAFAGGSIEVPGHWGERGARRRVRIRASDVSLALRRPADTTIINALPVRVRAVEPHDAAGVQVNVIAALGEDGSGAQIVARVTRRSAERLGLCPGIAAFAQIKGVALIAARTGAP